MFIQVQKYVNELQVAFVLIRCDYKAGMIIFLPTKLLTHFCLGTKRRLPHRSHTSRKVVPGHEVDWAILVMPTSKTGSLCDHHTRDGKMTIKSEWGSETSEATKFSWVVLPARQLAGSKIACYLCSNLIEKLFLGCHTFGQDLIERGDQNIVSAAIALRQ